MAKKAKKVPAKSSDHKYGVETLAKELGIQPASLRVALRKNNVKKAKDGVYGWDSQTDYEKVKKSLSKDKKSAPAKKAGKKTAKKASKKKSTEPAGEE